MTSSMKELGFRGSITPRWSAGMVIPVFKARAAAVNGIFDPVFHENITASQVGSAGPKGHYIVLYIHLSKTRAGWEKYNSVPCAATYNQRDGSAVKAVAITPVYEDGVTARPVPMLIRHLLNGHHVPFGYTLRVYLHILNGSFIGAQLVKNKLGEYFDARAEDETASEIEYVERG